jgi:anhydro-N-acetylmuramic acid kinase
LEWVKKYVFPILEESNISIIDQLCTYTEHIAFQLSKQFNKNSKVLVTGGGAFNLYLLKRINSFKHLKLLIPSNTLVEYKEALIFGFLGVLRLRGENNCLSSVTGAKKNHSSGTVFKIK